MKSMQAAIGDLEGLKRAIAASDFDAVVAASPENVTYISDVFISTQVDIRDRLALVVWDGSSDPVFVLCQVEEGYVRQESWIQDIRTYKEFVTAPIDVLTEILREKGLASGRIGLEMEYLGARYHAELERSLPNLSIDACDDLFAQVRMIKTPREREILTTAFRGTRRP